MISRRSAKAIADAYHTVFTGKTTTRGRGSGFKYYRNRLYDFLFVKEFDGWILNSFKKIHSTDRRGLREFIMRLHTGESLASGTPDWPWDRRRTLGQRVLKDLAEAMLQKRDEESDFGKYQQRKKTVVERMERDLELDGFILQNGLLIASEADVLDEEEERELLIRLVDEVGISDRTTIEHHLNLSVEHYEDERWDDSIANSRKVLEAVLQGAAEVYGARAQVAPLSSGDLDRAYRVRDWLHDSGLLEKKEKETLAKVYGLLSETGGHPYMAHKDQARLNRHLALTLTQFVLLRLRGALKSA